MKSAKALQLAMNKSTAEAEMTPVSKSRILHNTKFLLNLEQVVKSSSEKAKLEEYSRIQGHIP